MRTLGSPRAREGADVAVERVVAAGAFGLNFERHVPETVELPGRPVRKGDKARFLAERGEQPGSVHQRLWQVVAIRNKKGGRVAELARRAGPEAEVEITRRSVADLIVVAEFRDPIFPGLKSTGKVERGGEKTFHSARSSGVGSCFMHFTRSSGVGSCFMHFKLNA